MMFVQASANRVGLTQRQFDYSAKLFSPPHAMFCTNTNFPSSLSVVQHGRVKRVAQRDFLSLGISRKIKFFHLFFSFHKFSDL